MPEACRSNEITYRLNLWDVRHPGEVKPKSERFFWTRQMGAQKELEDCLNGPRCSCRPRLHRVEDVEHL